MSLENQEYLEKIADQIVRERIRQGELSHAFKAMLSSNPALSTLVRRKISEEFKLFNKSQ